MLEYFKKKRSLRTILLIVVFFGLGIYVGFHKQPEINEVLNVEGKETAVTTKADFSPFWKVWNNINEKYPTNDTTDQEKIYGAISGLVDSLEDPYSVFFNPDEAKLFEDGIQGNFGGIGIEIGIKDKVLTVIAPIKDTPAYKANMKSGDKILKIDDKVTSGMSIEKAIKLIRGDMGTTVRLTTFRDGDSEPKEFKLTRDNIDIPTLDTEMRDDGIFVIKLYSFSSNSAELFHKALKDFSLSGKDKLLLDLRGNPGGYLDSAVSMASWFLEGGKAIVIEDFGNSAKEKIYRSQGYDIFTEELKFVILIDNGSASASEILAGAMQDYKKALLVGEKSYGKGSVQEVVKITSDTLLKITVAKWLTPNGNSISEKGLTPDYEVIIKQKDLDKKKDTQLEKALELLKNWPGIKE